MVIDLNSLFGKIEENSKSAKKLLKALKENFQEDFDYLKFKKSVNSMMEMGMDKTTATKSAFATASTMGLTKNKLVKSIVHYQTVLNKEREQFAVALKNQIATNIDGKRVEAQKLVKEIEANKSKIAKLQEQIKAYQAKIDSVEEVVEKNRQKIESTRDSFKNAFDYYYDQIEIDLQNINDDL